ncbi:MAG: hypothetical protein KC473_00215 [Candidatus Dadabacteria bacterium]|nr:hypothetical protein [Candidatus Dadabacteria bacterium]
MGYPDVVALVSFARNTIHTVSSVSQFDGFKLAGFGLVDVPLAGELASTPVDIVPNQDEAGIL